MVKLTIYIHLDDWDNLLCGYECLGVYPSVGECIQGDLAEVRDVQFIVKQVFHVVKGDMGKADDEEDYGKLSYIDVLVEKISNGKSN